MKRKLYIISMVCLMILLFFTQTGFSPTPQTTPVPETEGLNARITQVDTSKFPKVNVYVSVTDANGEPVPVSPNRIVIRENGEVMKPDAIGGSEDVGPLTTLLVVDISGSMNHGGKLTSAKEAAKAYVDQARPSDKIGLVAFNTKIEYVRPLTPDRRKMIAAIDGLQAKDDTAMYDALAQGIDILEAEEGRKAIIVLTDGLDNRSKMSPQQVLQLIGPQGLSISVIGLGDPNQSTGAITSLDEPALKAFANEAGGVYGYANDSESLRTLYEKYGRALQSEYIFTYTSPSKLRDGVNRALSASVQDNSGSVLGSIESAISYNPGGLVPEVPEPASWLLFFGLLVGLVLLIFLPILFGLILPRRRGGGNGGSKKTGNIKLHSQTSSPSSSRPKIKLKG
jgi:VWFA-related protein